MKKTQTSNEQKILSNFSFNQSSRKFQLHEPAYAKRLVDLKIGTKLLKSDNTYQWSCDPQQFVYLISTLNLSPEIIMRVYAIMTSYQIAKTTFYIWMRKRGKLLKVATPQVYHIYANVQAYTINEQSCRIRVFQTDTSLQKINLSELKKQCDKFAVLRNRDMVIIDVL